jgi:hypothetical protein
MKFVHIIITAIIAMIGVLFMSAPAQAADGCITANCSGSNGEAVIGQPLEDVADAFVTPKVTISWPNDRERFDVAVTVDNRHGNKTYRAEIRTVLFAGNDVFADPSEATDALVGIDRIVKVKAGKVKTYKLFTYKAVTWQYGTIIRAKGTAMTNLETHERIKRYQGLGLDSVFAMEIWPTTPEGPDIAYAVCPTWFAYPSTWGYACSM